MSAERMEVAGEDLRVDEGMISRDLKRKRLLQANPEQTLAYGAHAEVEALVDECWKKMKKGEVPEDPRYNAWREVLFKVQTGETDVELYRPWPSIWKAYSVLGKGEEIVMVECSLCDKPIKVRRRRGLMQHFAGANHLQHVNRQQVDLRLAVYTHAELGDAAMTRCIDDLVSTYQERRPNLSKSTVVFRAMVSRVFHELGIPAEAMKNKMFRMLIAGKVPGQEMMSEAAVVEAAPAALVFEAGLVDEEANPDLNVSLLPTIAEPWTPYSIVHDGSDLFKGPLACTIVRWVDEREWKIRMRLNTAQRPDVKDASATGVATEISNGFIGPARPVAVIGDGTNSQFLGMIYASGDHIQVVDDGGATLTPTAPPVNFSIPGMYSGQVVVCFPHQLNNAGKRLWGSKSTLSKFVHGWRSLVGGYKGQTFARKWKEAWAKGARTSLSWYGKSLNPGSTTRWWTQWEMLADLLHHRAALIDFVFDSYFMDLTGEDAANVRFPLQNQVRCQDFLIHLAAVRLYGEPLVQMTYALESDGFIAPLVASKLDVIKKMIEATLDGPESRNRTSRRERSLLQKMGIRVDFIEQMRDKAADTFLYLARILGWKGLLQRLETKHGKKGPRSSNKIRDALLARNVEFFELTEVCIPRVSTPIQSADEIKEKWMELVERLPSAATGGFEDESALSDRVVTDLETYVDSPEVEAFAASAFPAPNESMDSAGERLWAWWGRWDEKWPGLVRVVGLVALYLPSSAVLERAFNTTTNRFTKLQHNMGSDRSTLTFQMAYNEKARRNELDSATDSATDST